MNLEQFGVVEISENEQVETVGGNFITDIVKVYIYDTVVKPTADWLRNSMVNDWNSRTGGQNTMTNIYSSNPLH